MKYLSSVIVIKKGWNPRELQVNGETIPHNMSQLLQWLVDEGFIKKWEKDIYDAERYLRNSLSHLEFVSVFTPNSQF